MLYKTPESNEEGTLQHLLSILFLSRLRTQRRLVLLLNWYPHFLHQSYALEVHHKMTTEQSQHNVHSLKEFVCKTESFRAGKEHCIIQTPLHAVMLSSKTAVLVRAFRFFLSPLSPSPFEGGGVHVPLCPHGGVTHAPIDTQLRTAS